MPCRKPRRGEGERGGARGGILDRLPAWRDRGARIVAEAVRRADRGGPRHALRCEDALIHVVYSEREEESKRYAARLRTEGESRKADLIEDLVAKRYPAEMADALRSLAGK